MPVVQGNTPERFGEALRSAKRYLDSSPELKTKLVTINSWNEWTEGSYLEPDEEHGSAYLDQIEVVFGKMKKEGETSAGPSYELQLSYGSEQQ